MHEIVAGRHVDADLPGRGVRWTGTAYAAPPTLPDRLTARRPAAPAIRAWSTPLPHQFRTALARLSRGVRTAWNGGPGAEQGSQDARSAGRGCRLGGGGPGGRVAGGDRGNVAGPQRCPTASPDHRGRASGRLRI